MDVIPRVRVSDGLTDPLREQRLYVHTRARMCTHVPVWSGGRTRGREKGQMLPPAQLSPEGVLAVPGWPVLLFLPVAPEEEPMHQQGAPAL